VGGCDREIFVSATSLLKLAKAGSATTLPQQKKINSADVQPGNFNMYGFICTVAR
jgi:hypothetical protein